MNHEIIYTILCVCTCMRKHFLVSESIVLTRFSKKIHNVKKGFKSTYAEYQLHGEHFSSLFKDVLEKF